MAASRMRHRPGSTVRFWTVGSKVGRPKLSAGFPDGGARRGFDRAAAESAAADFVPPEPGMWYLQVTRTRVSGNEPLVTLSELFDDGTEFRKIQRFPDGRTGLAGGSIDTELTWLDEEPVPSIEDLSNDPNLHAVRISPSEFQTEWLVAGGW
ncbi:DUF6881 domain-containing protein [Nocardia sp. NPDC059764]|uniref:DUF6881 domain-containing protein n=1 Tax=Nocardia sp. NPDC059764 TaxID=3346939 RepID=UPI003654D369